MRKALLIATAAAMLLVACKKNENGAVPSKKTYNLTFNVSSFSESTNTLGTTNSDKAHALSALTGSRSLAAIPVATPYLTALFYDASSNLIAKVTQTKASTPNYGTISVQLPLGRVYAFFIATDDTTYTLSLSKNNAKDFAAMSGGYPVISYNASYFGPPTTSIFTIRRSLNITGPSTESFKLTRAASLLTIAPEDVFTSPNAFIYYQQSPPNNALNLMEQTGEHTNFFSLVGQTIFPTLNQAGNTYSWIVWPGTGNTHLFAGENGFNKTLFAATDTIKSNTHYTFEGFMTNMRPTTTTILTDTTWKPPVNKGFAKHLQSKLIAQ